VKLVDRALEDLRVVVMGAGAAGVAVTKILRAAGVRDILVCDREGILHPGMADELSDMGRWIVEHTNADGVKGGVKRACKGAHAFIGVSGPGALPVAALKEMAKDPIVFALANPVPEILPEEAEGHVAVMATGRSDYPNQINNVLVFPGVFRGALDVRASGITEGMKLAAAHALARAVPEESLGPEFIIPNVFDRAVVGRVACAVAEAAVRDGVARKGPKG
jgi:malate dehydrogenase (oxaloacetate-decarboxylating)